MEYKNLLVEISENIATVTIDRPDVLNALNGETIMSLRKCSSISTPCIEFVT